METARKKTSINAALASKLESIIGNTDRDVFLDFMDLIEKKQVQLLDAILEAAGNSQQHRG